MKSISLNQLILLEFILLLPGALAAPLITPASNSSAHSSSFSNAWFNRIGAAGESGNSKVL